MDQPVLYNLATVNPNGTIQLNPVWGEVHEGLSASTPSPVAASTEPVRARRQGDRDGQRPADPLRYVVIRGQVEEMTDEKHRGDRSALAHYTGVDMASRRGRRRGNDLDRAGEGVHPWVALRQVAGPQPSASITSIGSRRSGGRSSGSHAIAAAG